MEDFIFDYSSLNRIALRKENVSLDEISSVFLSDNSIIHPQKGFDYMIGFSNRKKFIHIAYRVAKNHKFDIEILQAELPNEEDVKEYWCKGR